MTKNDKTGQRRSSRVKQARVEEDKRNNAEEPAAARAAAGPAAKAKEAVKKRKATTKKPPAKKQKIAPVQDDAFVNDDDEDPDGHAPGPNASAADVVCPPGWLPSLQTAVTSQIHGAIDNALKGAGSKPPEWGFATHEIITKSIKKVLEDLYKSKHASPPEWLQGLEKFITDRLDIEATGIHKAIGKIGGSMLSGSRLDELKTFLGTEVRGRLLALKDQVESRACSCAKHDGSPKSSFSRKDGGDEDPINENSTANRSAGDAADWSGTSGTRVGDLVATGGFGAALAAPPVINTSVSPKISATEYFHYPLVHPFDIDRGFGTRANFNAERGMREVERCYNGLLRFWTFKRAVRTHDYVHETSTNMLPEDFVINALNSVTEAITRWSGNSLEFSLYSQEVITSIREVHAHRQSKPDNYLVARRGKPILFVHNDSLVTPEHIACQRELMGQDELDDIVVAEAAQMTGHFRLVEAVHVGDTQVNLRICDSNHRAFPMSQITLADLRSDVVKTLKTMKWMSQESEVTKISHTKVAQQLREPDNVLVGNTCGIHVILNGWARAMALTSFLDTKQDDNFYLHALRLINLAIAGCADSALIYTFLVSRKYVERPEKGYLISVVHFPKTIKCNQNKDFDQHRRWVAGLEADGEAPAVSLRRTPDSPTWPDLSQVEEQDGADRAKLVALREELHAKFPLTEWIPDENLPQFKYALDSGEVRRRFAKANTPKSSPTVPHLPAMKATDKP